MVQSLTGVKIQLLPKIKTTDMEISISKNNTIKL